MAKAQIISVTTGDVGAAGPLRRLYAVNLDSPDGALEVIRKRLKPSETAVWVDTRSLTLSPGEIRQI